MKRKKFLAMLMALAMMLSLCVGALATDPAPAAAASSDPVSGNKSFSGEATVQVPTIAVSVPQTSTIFINPMGFQVKLDGSLASAKDAADEDVETTNSKIVSPIIPILNNSPMELSVGVIGSVAPKEGNVALAISATPIAADDTKNSVFVYALFGEPEYQAAVEADTTADPPVAAQPEKYSWPAALTTTYNATTPADHTLALTTKAPTTPVVVGNIDAATYIAAVEADTTADPPVAAQPEKTEPGRFAFQFLGDCTANPKTEWNANDAVTVSLAFTFKPATAPAATPAAGG